MEKRGEKEGGAGVGVGGVGRVAWWGVNDREVEKRGEKEGGVGVGEQVGQHGRE